MTAENLKNFDPYRNDMVAIHYRFYGVGRFTLVVRDSNWKIINTLVNNEVRTTGDYVACWDGRRSDGTLLGGSFNIYYWYPSSLPLNPIVLERTPIEFENFRAQAYLIHPAYDQVSTLNYELTRDANVTMTISDPQGNAVRILLSNVPQQAGMQMVEWDGRNAQAETVAAEGTYTVTMTAVDPVSEMTYQQKGVIVVHS